MEENRDRLVWGLSVLISCTALLPLVGWHPVAAGGPGSVIVHWWLLALLFVGAEALVVHTPRGRDSHSFTFLEVPLVLGLVFAAPADVAVGRVLGTLVAFVLVYRAPTIKTAFNVSAHLLQTTLALMVFAAVLGNDDALSRTGWLAAFCAVVVADMAGGLALFAAISVRSWSLDAGVLWENLTGGLVIAVVNTCLGIVAALVVAQDAVASALLATLAALTYAAFRGYHVLRQRYARLELLYEFTQRLESALTDGALTAVTEVATREARGLLRAGYAAVVLRDGDALRVLEDTGSEEAVDIFDVIVETGSPAARRLQWCLPAVEGRTVQMPAQSHRGQAESPPGGLRHRDALAVPMVGDAGPLGALVVAGRLDDTSTFDEDDTKLLQTLGAHVAMALCNTRLVEQVRQDAAAKERMALHDALTGLPNRVAFQARVDKALEAGRSPGVGLLNLDRFRDVNDTLGHDVGDELLREVAVRLSGAVREGALVAHLGADLFALLVSTDGDDYLLEEATRECLRAIEGPVRVRDIDLDVAAAAGLASTPRDGDCAVTLLRHAEVALYAAKEGLTRLVWYSSCRDPYSPRRLGMVSDLARALEASELTLHYQPQVDLGSRTALSVEALSRWVHPLWGSVSPGEFISTAEQTGLIHPLTRTVLRQALSQCASWRDGGIDVVVGVNVSARNLMDRRLGPMVSELLSEFSLAPESLVLEVTESALMDDPQRAVPMIERLVETGVGISVDDFGTGYSSLRLLRALPVEEIKIDRSFVQGMTASPADLAIVRSVVDLGHNLGMRVVAEGVENQATARALKQLGCDRVQGYFFARPLPSTQATRFLREQPCARPQAVSGTETADVYLVSGG